MVRSRTVWLVQTDFYAIIGELDLQETNLGIRPKRYRRFEKGESDDITFDVFYIQESDQ